MTISSNRVKFLDKQTSVLVQDFTKFTSNSILSNFITPGLLEEIGGLTGGVTGGYHLKYLSDAYNAFTSVARDPKNARVLYSDILKDISLNATQLSWVLPILDNLKRMSDEALGVFVMAMMKEVLIELHQYPKVLGDFRHISPEKTTQIFLAALRSFVKTMGGKSVGDMQKFFSPTMGVAEINDFVASLAESSALISASKLNGNEGSAPSDPANDEPDQENDYSVPVPEKLYPPDGSESSLSSELDITTVTKGRNIIAYCNWIVMKTQVLYASSLVRDPSDAKGDARAYYEAALNTPTEGIERHLRTVQSTIAGSGMYARDKAYAASKALKEFVSHGLGAVTYPDTPTSTYLQSLNCIVGFCDYILQQADGFDEAPSDLYDAEVDAVETKAYNLTLELVNAAGGAKPSGVTAVDPVKATQAWANMAVFLLNGRITTLAKQAINDEKFYDKRLYAPLKLWYAFIKKVTTSVMRYIETPELETLHAPLMVMLRDALMVCLSPYKNASIMPFDLMPFKPVPAYILKLASDEVTLIKDPGDNRILHPHFGDLKAIDASIRVKVFAFLKALISAEVKWFFNGEPVSTFEGSSHPGAPLLLAYYIVIINTSTLVKEAMESPFQNTEIGKAISAGTAEGSTLTSHDIGSLFALGLNQFTFTSSGARTSMLKEYIKFENLELTENSGIVSTEL